MLKKIAAVAGGVFIGLIIAFARAGAFPFWGSGSDASKAPPSSQQAQAAPAAPAAPVTPPQPLPAPPVPGVHVAPPPQPAQPNTPEPNEKVGVVTSFAPLVKRMIPAVVSVAAAGAMGWTLSTAGRADGSIPGALFVGSRDLPG